MRLANLELQKEEFNFSAGHFTIFSATEREYLHGHNYQVSVAFKIMIATNGMSFDYRYYKEKIHTLCAHVDRKFMLPNASPYLTLEEHTHHWIAKFNNETITFPKTDVVILPVVNTTIEELSHWFLQQLLTYSELETHGINAIEVKVYNGPGQSGGAAWKREVSDTFKVARGARSA